MYSFNTHRIREHAYEMRDNRQRRTTVENNWTDSGMNGVPEITEQDKTRDTFCEDYEAVRKRNTNSTAHISHDPQPTVLAALHFQQIKRRCNVYSFYWISIVDNLKRIIARSRTLKTNTIVHISHLIKILSPKR